MNSAFGLYSDRVIELANHVFSPMYRRIFKQYWDNSMHAKMRKAYFHSDIMNGRYEVYLPTFEHKEFNMNFYRIAIQVLPEIDRDMMKKESLKLIDRHVSPVGFIDSEMLVLVAPHRTEKGRNEKQYLRGHRSLNAFVCPVLSDKPEVCIERIIKIVSGFFKKRLEALIKKLHLDKYLDLYKEYEHVYYTLTLLVEKFSYSLASSIKCLSHTLYWLKTKLNHVYGEKRLQAHLKTLIYRFEDLKPVLQNIVYSPKYLHDMAEDPPILKPLIQILMPERK